MRVFHTGLMLFVAAAVHAQPQAAVDKVKAEIVAARDAFWAAHGRSDAKALAGLLTEDARLLAPGMEDIRGRAAIEAGAVQMFQALSVEDFRIESSEITVHGDSAYELATYSETLRPRGGQPAPARGRYLILWKRDASGKWKVHRNMFHFISGGH
jgi:uncharacterized protein (TIGR02246 family)